MRGKRLTRQLRKSFGDESGEKISSLQGLPAFLDQVEDTYKQLDEKVEMAESSLAISSKELAEANQILFRTNQTIDAMVNSLGQGFLLFDRHGRILPLTSKACELLLETRPDGMDLSEVLKMPKEKSEEFKEWLSLLFDEVMEFEEFALSGPRSYSHSKGLVIGLELKPVRDNDGKIEYVVLIATDHTAVVAADKNAQDMYSYAKMAVTILKDPDSFNSYIFNVRRMLKECVALLLDKAEISAASFDCIKRNLHTIKGASGTYGFAEMKNRIHDLESRLTEQFDMAHSSALLRQEVPVLRDLFEEKLLRHKDIIGDINALSAPKREIPVALLYGFAERMRQIQGLNSTLYSEFIEELICVSIEKIVSRYDSVVQEVASRLGKKVDPILYRGDLIRVVPENYGKLWTTLHHMFRNIVDHGIETPEERINSGKLPVGRIWIDCNIRRHDSKNASFDLIIHDDGRGLNYDSLRDRAVTLKGKQFANSASDEEIAELIFAGASTATQVSDISGRGIGLSALRREIQAVGGEISVHSERGLGTTFTIVLPVLSSFLDEKLSFKRAG